MDVLNTGLPQALTVASGFVFYYVEMFKAWFKPLAPSLQIYKLGVMLISILLGGLIFVIGDGVSDVFEGMFPSLPYFARLAIAAHVLGLGSKFTHRIWSIFTSLNGSIGNGNDSAQAIFNRQKQSAPKPELATTKTAREQIAGEAQG